MKKIKRFFGIILSALLLSSCAPNEASSGYRRISMDDAVSMMKNEKNYIILDVRTSEEFADGHIPGAINYANEDIGAEEISCLPNKSQLILVYCRSGRRSKIAAQALVDLGYTNVKEFGGIIDWKYETEK